MYICHGTNKHEKWFLMSSIEYRFLVAFLGSVSNFCFVVVPSHVGNGRAGKWAARGNVSIGSACRWGICIRFLLKASRLFFSSFLRFNNLSRLLRWQCAVISRKAGNSRHSILFCRRRRRRFLSFFFCLHHAATEPPIRLKSHSLVRSFLLTSSFYSPTDRLGWRWEWQKINKKTKENEQEGNKKTNKTAWTIKILRHGWWKSETTTGDRTPNEKTSKKLPSFPNGELVEKPDQMSKQIKKGRNNKPENSRRKKSSTTFLFLFLY